MVAFPPMKPDACTKVHPGMPARSERASSRIPRHLKHDIEHEGDASSQTEKVYILFRQRFSTVETVGRNRNRLDPPFATLFGIDDVDGFFGVWDF